MITGRSQARIRNRENRERENREPRERERQYTHPTQDHELYMRMFRRRIDRLRRRLDALTPPIILDFP